MNLPALYEYVSPPNEAASHSIHSTSTHFYSNAHFHFRPDILENQKKKKTASLMLCARKN